MSDTNTQCPWIVSVAFNWHDSSVAIARGPEVRLVLEAERVFRIKKLRCDATQMNQLLMIALKEVGITPDQVNIWCGTAFGNRWLPDGEPALRDVQWRRIEIFGREVQLRCVNHHRAHAAMYFASPYDHAVVLSCDGGGDDESHVSFLAEGLRLERLEKTETMRMFSSIFYDRASFYLYGNYRQEGKFMGLAGWGDVDDGLKDNLVNDMDPICNLVEEEGVELLRKLYPLQQFDSSNRRVRNFAATTQKVFEEFRLITSLEHSDLAPNLVLVGGSALNVLANYRILKEAGYQSIYVPPCCDDTGQALGALLDTIAVELGVRPHMYLPFLGRGLELPNVMQEEIAEIARELASGKVIVWHCGRSEIGPRALGHRSLLASPETMEMKSRVSEQLKQREAYRPVAPMVLSEFADQWFDIEAPSPYMNFSAQAAAKCKETAPAVVHVDGSARVQTIAQDGDPILRSLLSYFYELTGIPILINTSLNGRDQPICDTVADTRDWLYNIRHSGLERDISFALDGHRTELNESLKEVQ